MAREPELNSPARTLARVDQEDRIALFLDYENLALGARDHLGGMAFDFRPIADALAERGRVVVRRAYADWSYFDEDRRMLTRSHVELIEIPQRMGASRKNAADIKMAVDAMELAFERDYISTFVHLHRRQRLHPAGPQAARAQQAGHRRRRREVHLGAAAAGLRRVPLLRPPGGRRDPAGRAPGAAARPGRPAPEPQPVEQEPEPQPAAGGTRPRRRHARRPRRPDRGRPAGQLQRRGDRLDAQAHPAPEGPDLQRVRLRVPRLRGTPAAPRRAQRGRAGRGPGQGRPRGVAARARRPGGGVRAAALRGRRTWPAATARWRFPV